jgi:hypothetical protein
MSGPDSISDPVARRPTQNLIPRLGSNSARLNSARLSSTRLGATQLGSCLMTWQVGPTVLACQLTRRWHGMPTGHAYVILIQVWHMGRVNWYSGRVSPSGRRWLMWSVVRVCARGQPPRRSVMARAAVFDFWFCCGFQQWLRFFLFYTVVWSKHNFDNFYFWAKIKHHFKPNALIPIVRNSDRWCYDICPFEVKHTETQYLMWFSKITYIHGRSQYY